MTSIDVRFKYLLAMKLRLEAMLCSNFGNAKFDVGYIKCSRGPQATHPTAYLRYGRICHIFAPVANRPMVSLLGLSAGVKVANFRLRYHTTFASQ